MAQSIVSLTLYLFFENAEIVCPFGKWKRFQERKRKAGAIWPLGPTTHRLLRGVFLAFQDDVSHPFVDGLDPEVLHQGGVPGGLLKLLRNIFVNFIKVDRLVLLSYPLCNTFTSLKENVVQ